MNYLNYKYLNSKKSINIKKIMSMFHHQIMNNNNN